MNMVTYSVPIFHNLGPQIGHINRLGLCLGKEKLSVVKPNLLALTYTIESLA